MKASCANIDTGCTCPASLSSRPHPEHGAGSSPRLQRQRTIPHPPTSPLLPPPVAKAPVVSLWVLRRLTTAGWFGVGLLPPLCPVPPSPTFHVADDILIGVLEAVAAVPLPSTARDSCTHAVLRLSAGQCPHRECRAWSRPGPGLRDTDVMRTWLPLQLAILLAAIGCQGRTSVHTFL